MTSFKITNELRNVEIDKLIEKPTMKPRYNPIHYRFIDENDEVFHKFNIPNEYGYERGSHNIVYKNENFVIRISRKIFHPNNLDPSSENLYYIDERDDVFINNEIKKEDDLMLLKASKANISPHLYFVGNIKINDKIHRYSVSEAYNLPLSKFIKCKKYGKIILKNGYYKTIEEVLDDIVNQVVELIDNILNINVVYYDMKPENIVVKYNEDKNERLILKVIDWDSDFCIEEKWLNDENKECVKFIKLMTIGSYLYRYYNNNIFDKKVNELYNELMLPKIYLLLFDMRAEFMNMILHYFYKSFEMNEYERDNFDESVQEMRESMEKHILKMIEMSQKRYRSLSK